MKAALIALALLATPAAADTNLLVNGDFSGGTYTATGTITCGFYGCYNYTKQVPNGWTASPGYFSVYSYAGLGFVSLGNNVGDPLAAISQTITDTAGTSYLGTFDLFGKFFSPAYFFEVLVNDNVVFFLHYDTPFVGGGQFQFQFVGSGSDTLTFGGENSIGNYGISAISVVAVPEPSTWALLLFGFAFLGMREIWPGASHE